MKIHSNLVWMLILALVLNLSIATHAKCTKTVPTSEPSPSKLPNPSESDMSSEKINSIVRRSRKDDKKKKGMKKNNKNKNRKKINKKKNDKKNNKKNNNKKNNKKNYKKNNKKNNKKNRKNTKHTKKFTYKGPRRSIIDLYCSAYNSLSVFKNTVPVGGVYSWKNLYHKRLSVKKGDVIVVKVVVDAKYHYGAICSVREIVGRSERYHSTGRSRRWMASRGYKWGRGDDSIKKLSKVCYKKKRWNRPMVVEMREGRCGQYPYSKTKAAYVWEKGCEKRKMVYLRYVHGKVKCKGSKKRVGGKKGGKGVKKGNKGKKGKKGKKSKKGKKGKKVKKDKKNMKNKKNKKGKKTKSDKRMKNKKNKKSRKDQKKYKSKRKHKNGKKDKRNKVEKGNKGNKQQKKHKTNKSNKNGNGHKKDKREEQDKGEGDKQNKKDKHQNLHKRTKPWTGEEECECVPLPRSPTYCYYWTDEKHGLCDSKECGQKYECIGPAKQGSINCISRPVEYIIVRKYSTTNECKYRKADDGARHVVPYDFPEPMMVG